jgi:hypothetical protein
MYNLILRKTQQIIECMPRTGSPNIERGYRPITLLNEDYKVLGRVMANGLQSTLTRIMHPVRSHNTLDAYF